MKDYDLVREEISHLVGTPVGEWSEREATAVDACIRRGIDQAIHNGVHQWTWMRPVHRFKTADGVRRYTLPLDFEQFIDCISFDGDEYYPPIEQKPATRLMQLESENINTSVPCYFATENPAHDGVTQQHQQLVLHPTPDATYSLIGIYQVGPIRSLSASHPYFPGGPANRELFLLSCLAAAESKFYDKQDEKHDAYQAKLAAAISEDLRRQPRNLGQMGGRRMGRIGRGGIRQALGWKLQTQYNGGLEL